MTVSKRLAEKKVAKFEKNITKRGTGPIPPKKTFDPEQFVIILFAVLMVVSFIFQMVRMAIYGGIFDVDGLGFGEAAFGA